MRMTIVLPDDLFREVKPRLALDGMKLKDLIARYVEMGLRHNRPIEPAKPTPAKLSQPPLIPEAMTGTPIPALTGRELADLELQEDLKRISRSAGR